MLFLALNIGSVDMKLKEIANIRSGLVLARKQSREPSKFQYPLLNLRSIKPDGQIDMEQIDTFNAVEILNTEYLTHRGDIVVRLSVPYTAVLIDASTERLVIPSSFVIIRANRREILPEYLYWLLNTPKVRQLIYENTTGNMLGSIKPSYFSDFDITPLSIEHQAAVAELNRLAQKETQLLVQLAAEKEKYYARAIDRFQKQLRKGN